MRSRGWAAVLAPAALAVAVLASAHTGGGRPPARAEAPPAIGATDVDALEFYVLANAQFTLLHELGHALIHTLKLPVLGREEDAADTLAIAGLLIGEMEQLQQPFCLVHAAARAHLLLL